MQKIINQLAIEAGVSPEEANCIFTAIAKQLVIKIPALKQVIEDVFENVEDNTFKEHISKLIMHLQEQLCMEKSKTWSMPQLVRRVGQPGNYTIL